MKTKAKRPVSGREMRERKERAARDVMRTLGELIDDLKIRLEAAEQEDAEAEGR